MFSLDPESLGTIRNFFNDKHEIILCSASGDGVPNAALMGSCRLSASGEIEFEISEPKSSPAQTFRNIQENRNVMFMRFVPGPRARDYKGLRIYATVSAIESSGPKIEAIVQLIREKHGEEKAAEVRATVSCRISNIRPVLDRQQEWKSAI